jgi:hypothetical protein
LLEPVSPETFGIITSSALPSAEKFALSEPGMREACHENRLKDEAEKVVSWFYSFVKTI